MNWSSVEYNAWSTRWREAWHRLRSCSEGWESPWLDDSARDGNPMFSARSLNGQRGIRVLQHPENRRLHAWPDSYNKQADVLVIACGLDESSFATAMPLIERVLQGEATMRVHPCKSCDTPTDHPWEVCVKCYRDPATNNCTECGKHLSDVPYPYVCGDCLRKGAEQP